MLIVQYYFLRYFGGIFVYKNLFCIE